jgi:hypothetical protein
MKKIMFVLFLVANTFATNAQKLSVVNVVVNVEGIATLTLSDGSTRNIRAIINPTYNQNSKAVGARLTGQAIMLTPPIKPASWEKDGEGNINPVGFRYNQGFDPYAATVYLVEGTWTSDGKSRSYFGREQVGSWVSTPNPADWVAEYEVNTYKIANFTQTTNVTKTLTGGYFIK